MIAKALASLAALVALSLPAAAQAPEVKPVVTGPGTRYFSGRPPARFIKPMAVPAIFAHPEQLYAMCGLERIPGMKLRGCVRSDKNGVKWVIMPHPGADPDPSNWFVLLHELGHAAGWGANHEL
jgi:hypothetical protein